MIELIFVIVILGVLAAVAIPRLAATRNDAQNSTVKANVATCLTDLVSAYTAREITLDNTISDSCQFGNLDGAGLTVTDNDPFVQVTGDLNGVPATFSLSAIYKGTQVSI